MKDLHVHGWAHLHITMVDICVEHVQRIFDPSLVCISGAYFKYGEYYDHVKDE